MPLGSEVCAVFDSERVNFEHTERIFGFTDCKRLNALALTVYLTCSLMLLMPSGPSRLTACFTRSVRPQLSIRKPRSCRNFASVEAASSLLEAQTQSSVLKWAKHEIYSTRKCTQMHCIFS